MPAVMGPRLVYKLHRQYCQSKHHHMWVIKSFLHQDTGPGALMSKIDFKNAFRLIPIGPQDWNLLGMHWWQQFYIDICLPFGLRSGPYLFNQLSIAIHWILQHSYNVQHPLHYLDDFFTAGPAASPQCADNLQSMFTLCENINAQ